MRLFSHLNRRYNLRRYLVQIIRENKVFKSLKGYHFSSEKLKINTLLLIFFLMVPHGFCFFFFKVPLYLFIYLWLCWVFVSVRGLSLVAASGGHSSSRCAGLSLSWPLPLRSTGSRRAGSVIVAHGRSCSAACGLFPDQGSNPCPLH